MAAAKYEVKVAHEVPPGTTASFQEFTLPKPFALVTLRDECKNILGLGNDFPLYIVDHAGDKVLLRDDSHLQLKLARFSPETQDLKFWVGAASTPSPAQPSGIKHQADAYAATHRKISAQQAVVFRQDFTHQQTHEWFAQCYKMDDAPYDISKWDVNSWPSGQEVVQGDTNPAHQFLHYLLKASGAKLRRGPEPPVWVGALTETLREQGRIVAATLLGNFIYCEDLAGEQVIVGQPKFPTIFASWKKPNMETSSDSRLNSAMCLLEAQCKNCNNKTLQDLSEFDITIRFLAHIFDEPIGLCGVKQLNEYADELNVPVTFEWRRTKLEATAGQIPDAYLYMALRESRREKKFPLLYIEDKRTSAPSGLVADDVIKILALARNSHDGICKAFQLNETGACSLIIPAVVTKWPEITLYGVCRLLDNTYAAKELKKVNFTAHIGVAPSELTVGSDAAKEREYERLFGFHVLALVKNACTIIASHRNAKAKLVYLPAYKWANSEWQEISKSSKPLTVPATTASSPAAGGQALQLLCASTLPGSQLVLGDRVASFRVVVKEPRVASLESNVLHALSGHPNIPPLLPLRLQRGERAASFDSTDSDDSQELSPPQSSPLLFLPYLPDEPVRSFDELKLLACGLCSALQALHSAGYVHRDVKRRNIRHSGKNTWLIDFDLAAPCSYSDRLYSVVGTEQWQAPEMLSGCGYGQAVDLYGVGLILLEESLILCNSSFRVRNIDFESFELYQVHCLLPDVPAWLSLLIVALLQPEERRATAEDILSGLYW